MGVAALVIVTAGIYGRYYWTVGRFLESTDDAYVQADSTIVAPKVSGYLSEVLVADNQPVKAGFKRSPRSMTATTLQRLIRPRRT